MADALWFRLPLWCIGREHRDEAVVAMWVLGEWHVGRPVPAAAIKTEFGWGWDRSARFLAKLWTWANESGATRPSASPVSATFLTDQSATKTPQDPHGAQSRTKSGSERGGNGEKPGRHDADTNGVVEADRGGTGERAGSDRGVSCARDPLVEIDERSKIESPTGTAGAAQPSPPPAHPKKPKSTPKAKREPPAHSRDVIAAWCEVFTAAAGGKYPVNGREVGALSTLAADYVTGPEWEPKLAVLRAGMDRYARAVNRWPPGPPTVSGFAQDPARWMQEQPAATSARPARRSSVDTTREGLELFHQLLESRNAHPSRN